MAMVWCTWKAKPLGENRFTVFDSGGTGKPQWSRGNYFTTCQKYELSHTVRRGRQREYSDLWRVCVRLSNHRHISNLLSTNNRSEGSLSFRPDELRAGVGYAADGADRVLRCGATDAEICLAVARVLLVSD